MRRVLQQDATLQELLKSPLMLSIMSLAYSGLSVDKLAPKQGAVTERRKHLFDAYVERMFARIARTKHELYPQRQTIRWLRWLAQQMSKHGQTVFLIERMQPSWLQTHVQRRIFSIGSGLLSGLPFGLLVGLSGGLLAGLVVGVSAGLLVRLFGGLGDIEPAESLKWSWSKLSANLKSTLLLLLIVGLVYGLVGGLVVGVSAGLLFGLFGGLFSGLSVEQTETKTKPNQGIWQSGRNALFVVLIVGLLWLLIVGLLFGLVVGLVLGLLSGLVFGLGAGGLAFIQHFMLRFILWREGYIPRNYARVLDYAAERIFLRKVGGGYIFIHRMLQEYFAGLET